MNREKVPLGVVSLESKRRKYERELEAIKALINQVDFWIPELGASDSTHYADMINIAEKYHLDLFELEDHVYGNPSLEVDEVDDGYVNPDWQAFNLLRARRIVYESFFIYLFALVESLQRDFLSIYLFQKKNKKTEMLKFARLNSDYEGFYRSVERTFKDNRKSKSDLPRTWAKLYETEVGPRNDLLLRTERSLTKFKNEFRNPLAHDNPFRTNIWSPEGNALAGQLVDLIKEIQRYKQQLYAELTRSR